MEFSFTTDFLPSVETYAETTLEVSVERAAQTYQWEGYGLSLHVPKGTKTYFNLKAVSSKKFELPEGTELVSAVYWVSCEGEVGGPVGVELQHCARVREGGKSSGMSFAVCRAVPPYQFELCEGQFRSGSNYGRMEMGFSDWFLTTVRRIAVERPLTFVRNLLHLGPKQESAVAMFLAKLYYEQQQQLPSATAHFVILPYLEICQVRRKFKHSLD